MITITETARQKVAQLQERFSQPVKGLRVSAVQPYEQRAGFLSSG